MITFYDIPSKRQAWSPSTWKTRYSLNYKGLEYKTEWVEYPDIAEMSKRLGIPPTSYNADGSPYYSLPAISDSSTGVAIADSLSIAKYLDKTYLHTPKLVPDGTEAFHRIFQSVFSSGIVRSPIRTIIIPHVATFLNPRSEEYYTCTRSASFGKNLQDVPPQRAEREEAWMKFREKLSTMNGWLEGNGGKGPYFMGDTICFADFVLAAYLQYLRVSFGEDSLEWKDIKSWNDGRWDQLLSVFEKYETLH